MDLPNFLKKDFFARKKCKNQCLEKGFTRCQCPQPSQIKALAQSKEMFILYKGDHTYNHWELKFDEHWSTLKVTEKLGLREQIPVSSFWVIVDYWKTTDVMNYYRILEDHELAMEQYIKMREYQRENKSQFRFALTQDVGIGRYTFLERFPYNMFWGMYPNAVSPSFGSTVTIKHVHCLEVVYVVLKHDILYRVNFMSELNKLRKIDFPQTAYFNQDRYEAFYVAESIDLTLLTKLADLKEYQIYASNDATGTFTIKDSIVLRPIKATGDAKEICILCSNGSHREKWLISMRLAKYGKQIRENYRAFKARQTEIKPVISNPDSPPRRSKHDESEDMVMMTRSPTTGVLKIVDPESQKKKPEPLPVGTLLSDVPPMSAKDFDQPGPSGISSSRQAIYPAEPSSPSTDSAFDDPPSGPGGLLDRTVNPGLTDDFLHLVFRSRADGAFESRRTFIDKETVSRSINEVMGNLGLSRGPSKGKGGKTKSSRKKRDDDSHAAPQTETLSNHVPMDFTGEEGKIVDDPEEARKIAEGSECGQRSITAPRTSRSIGNAIDEGAHFSRPWYHDSLSREEATEMILQCQLENPDGLFIVRPSRTITGTYVLSYRFQNKIYHVQISSAVDRLTKLTVYSIDGGRRRFLDINKLIEFYENNSCTLSCRLTHYLQKNENFDPNSPENARKYEAIRLQDDEYSYKSENGNLLGSTSRTTSPKIGDNQKN